MKEAETLKVGNTYFCSWDPYQPKVECILDNRGVFMPTNTNTPGLFQVIRGVYEK